VKDCRWPKGCSMPVGQVDGADDDLCYYHSKIVAGWIDARELAAGHGSVGVRRGDVLSAEQAEIADVLRKLGAPEWVIQRSLSKQLRIGDRGRSNRGTKHGRLQGA
jgi:hypothetical protein